MNEDKQAAICISVLFILVTGMAIYTIFFEEDKSIPSEEQKPKEQVTTEINTHVIRCTTYVNETCTEYKVYSVIKE